MSANCTDLSLPPLRSLSVVFRLPPLPLARSVTHSHLSFSSCNHHVFSPPPSVCHIPATSYSPDHRKFLSVVERFIRNFLSHPSETWTLPLSQPARPLRRCSTAAHTHQGHPLRPLFLTTYDTNRHLVIIPPTRNKGSCSISAFL